MKRENSIVTRLYSIIGSMVSAIAVNLTVKPASIFGVYQPKAPKSIK